MSSILDASIRHHRRGRAAETTEGPNCLEVVRSADYLAGGQEPSCDGASQLRLPFGDYIVDLVRAADMRRVAPSLESPGAA